MKSNCRVLKRHVKMACLDGMRDIEQRREHFRAEAEQALREMRVAKRPWLGSWFGKRALTEQEIQERLQHPRHGDHSDHLYYRSETYKFLLLNIRAANICADDHMVLTLRDAAALRTWLSDASRDPINTELGNSKEDTQPNKYKS